MGLVHQEDLQDYWSKNNITGTPFFSTVMPRDRFILLLTFLHYSDDRNFIPQGQDGYDPLYKLGTPYHEITHRFTTNYYPTKNIAIDEGLVPWKGKIHFRVDNSAKPGKCGIKSYQLCDQTGYCCKYELYTGKCAGGSGNGARYDLCMRMMDRYLNRGHHLYVDDLYTSPTLFSHLYQQGTGACGTLKTHRKHVPEIIKATKPAQGEVFVAHNEPLMIMKYYNHTEVSLCSTIHRGVMKETSRVDRESDDPIQKPDAIIDYNKCMGVLDRCDQMLQCTGMRRRTFKWYKKVMFHLYDLCTLQAYLLYKMRTEKPVSHKVFKRDMVEQMIATCDLPVIYAAGRHRSEPGALQRLQDQIQIHHLDKIEVKGGKVLKNPPCRRCVVCTSGEKQLLRQEGKDIPKVAGHRTALGCPGCGVALCAVPCFRIYHTYVDTDVGYIKWKKDQ